MSTLLDRDSLPTGRPARNRYTSVACLECQRRKQKCSGHRICTLCRLRGVDCAYPKTLERRRRRKGPQPTADIQIDEEEQEPSIQDLVGRVRELEVLLRRINELSNGIQFDPTLTTTNQRTVGPSQTATAPQQQPLVASIDSTADVLQLPEPDNDWQISKHLSLSDAFRTTCASLGLDPSRDLSLLSVDPDEILPIPFPGLPSAQKLLGVCAERLGIYVPILDSDYSENGFLKKIAFRLASEQNPVALVKRRDLVLLGHFYMEIALGSCLQHDDDFSQTTSQGWSFYCQGLRLIDRVATKPYQLVGLAKFHLLRATYLLQAGLSQSAMEAISAAACLAIQAGLNNELSWAEFSPDERMFRKRLWWSIYVMDRRVAEKCCKPYIIRDEEIAVDELEPREISISPSPENPVAGEVAKSGQFLQALIKLGRLWANIWDKFFSSSASRSEALEDVEIMDIRLLHLQHSLPVWLRVRDDDIQGPPGDQHPDLEVQRRLVIYTRTNLLRMLIRQNRASPSRSNADASRFCIQRAIAVAKSIRSFISLRLPLQVQPMAYFLTSALVECAYHVSKAVENKALESERPTANEALVSITQHLVALGRMFPTARRVLSSLNLSCDTTQAKGMPDKVTSCIDHAWAGLNKGNVSNHAFLEVALDPSLSQKYYDTMFLLEDDYRPPVQSHSSGLEAEFLANLDLLSDTSLGRTQSNLTDIISEDILTGHVGTNWMFWQ